MSLLMFEGPAGTGKTTRLLAAAREHLDAHPLERDQRVLALTKYHGSRRRMDTKLRDRERGVGNFLDCVTNDSFAWHLIRRWRSLATHLGLHPTQGDFASVTGAAGTLLRHVQVAKWIARHHPVVVVDEMQDCKRGEVRILGGLEPHVRLLCGADAFQDLSGDATNEAIAWATSVGEVVSLEDVHRTDVVELLDAARALRNGDSPKSTQRHGFEIVSLATAPQAGAIMCWRILSWSKHGPIAVISATKPGTSPFPDNVLTWVSTKTTTSKKGSTAGPYPTAWESGDDEVKKAVLDVLNLPSEPNAAVDCRELATTAHGHGHHDVSDWFRRLLFVRGVSTATVAEVTEEVGHIVRRRRAFGAIRPWRRRAMTIHQAKNREFESVIVLWPLRMGAGLEAQRRLLYNAITRARERALVIVEDPKNKRLKEALFTGGG